MDKTSIIIPSGDIKLEGIIHRPTAQPVAGAVVCHPHPLFGGSMENSVVMAVSDALCERGMSVLRFNCRGAGKSEGSYGWIKKDKADVRSAVSFISSEESLESIALVGYSWGCWVGFSSIIDDPRVKVLIGISPSIDAYDFNFMIDCTKPKLFIVGDNDKFISKSDFLVFYEKLSSPKEYLFVQGTDHFYVGKESVVSDKCSEFLSRFFHP
jgi:hypothetical protein